MPEWRRDPITGLPVIIAEGRAARPVDYPPAPSESGSANCPFCEGHESSTPPELSARRAAGSQPNGPGWHVRVIPNKFPTFVSASVPRGTPEGPASLRTSAATGIHEVVVQSPTHAPGMAYLPTPQVRIILEVYRERLRVHEAGPAGSIVLGENWGPDSGGSLVHPHGQLLATPEIVPGLEASLAGTAARAAEWHVPCPVEHLLGQELAVGERIVHRGVHFVAAAPFASVVPYQLRFVPRRHARSFSEATDAEVAELAELLPRVVRAFLDLFPGGSYNILGLFPSVARAGPPGFHYAIDLLPRLVKGDAFELASHVAVNPIAPELAAERYRTALAPRKT